MLWNPDWDRLPSFKSFIEKQDGNKTYPYCDSGNCACAQYLQSEEKYVEGWLSGVEGMRNLNDLARGETGPEGLDSSSWTFGKLLDRVNSKIKELETV